MSGFTDDADDSMNKRNEYDTNMTVWIFQEKNVTA